MHALSIGTFGIRDVAPPPLFLSANRARDAQGGRISVTSERRWHRTK
jgi:hypothetical protein